MLAARYHLRTSTVQPSTPYLHALACPLFPYAIPSFLRPRVFTSASTPPMLAVASRHHCSHPDPAQLYHSLIAPFRGSKSTFSLIS